jgi:guanosine-3',5'-bis(diphosphate) 3'-pyrophosphohydrolase
MTTSDAVPLAPNAMPGALATAPPQLVSIDTLLETAGTYLPSDQLERLHDAYLYARDAHDGQFRATGDEYITHPIAVAHVLALMRMDTQTLMAALLHDVIEDTGSTRESLAERFDPTVAELVDGVSKLTNVFHSKARAQAENFQKMALAMARDIRVILVKMADRLHNMRTIHALGPEKRRRIARETLELYAPLANRLGMNNIRLEFEELGFKALHPMRSELIRKAVRNAKGNRSALLEQLRRSIAEALEAEGIEADRSAAARSTSTASTGRCARSGRPSPTSWTCFACASSSTASTPATGSSASCTTVQAGRRALQGLHRHPQGERLPVPAHHPVRPERHAHRDPDPHHGHGSPSPATASPGTGSTRRANQDNPAQQRARAGSRRCSTCSATPGTRWSSSSTSRSTCSRTRSTCSHPRGASWSCPRARARSTSPTPCTRDVGNTCVACRIDRRLAPLSTQLQSGQTVEIITSEDGHPTPDWLDFVVSGKARSSIRLALRHQQATEARALGRRLLSRSLKNVGRTLDGVPDDALAALLERLDLPDRDRLYEEIGLGNLLAFTIARQLLADPDDDVLAVRTDGPIAIRGSEGMVVTYARCCHPLPGEPIVGHLSSGKGLVIHLQSCRNVPRLSDDREPLLNVRWADRVKGEFSVRLLLEMERRKGMIAEVASAITAADALLDRLVTEERDHRVSRVEITVNVTDRVHLAHVMRRLRGLKPVTRISRVRS